MVYGLWLSGIIAVAATGIAAAWCPARYNQGWTEHDDYRWMYLRVGVAVSPVADQSDVQSLVLLALRLYNNES